MIRYSDVNIWNRFSRSFPTMSKDAVKFTVDDQTRVTVYLTNGNAVIYNFIANRIEARLNWGDRNPYFGNELELRNHILISIRSAMVIRKITQSELAELVGVSRPQMNRYINGVNPIPTYILIKIAESLKILFSDLVNV